MATSGHWIPPKAATSWISVYTSEMKHEMHVFVARALGSVEVRLQLMNAGAAAALPILFGNPLDD